jgi:membrane-bound serine protease (ClpP class)
MLFDRPEPVFRLSLAVIIPATVLTATFFIFVVGAGLRAQILPVRAGRETMIGKTVSALTDISDRGGKVFIEGETWNAISPVHVEAGQPVEVVGVQGLTLTVKAGKTFNGVTQ